MRILTIEVDSSTRGLLHETLERFGHAPLCMYPHQVSIGAMQDVLRELQPEIIVMTYYIHPRLSGADVCRALRAEYSHSELPIIITVTSSEHYEISRAAGANAVLYVPVSPLELIKTVEAVSRKERGLSRN